VRARAPRILLLALSGVLALLVVGYIVISAYLATEATRARRSLPRGTPADQGLTYEPVTFPSAGDGIQLRGWYLPGSGQKAIVMVHGIDGNRWDTTHHTDELAGVFVRDGYDVLVFDLRGCGESGGERLGLGWLERQDVKGAVSVVLGRGVPSGNIGLWGQSFGGASVLLAAPEIPEVAAVVSDAAFADARPLLDGEINRRTGLPPLFTPGISVFTSAFYGLDLAAIPPERAVPRIAPRPLLIIHGDADRRIPVEHGYRLKGASASPSNDLWIVAGAEHAEAFNVERQNYSQRVLSFYARSLS
jgi:uncharacterized protein